MVEIFLKFLPHFHLENEEIQTKKIKYNILNIPGLFTAENRSGKLKKNSDIFNAIIYTLIISLMLSRHEYESAEVFKLKKKKITFKFMRYVKF